MLSLSRHAKPYFFYILIFYATIAMHAHAQSCIYPWGVEAGVGLSEYNGKHGNGFYKFDVKPHTVSPGEDSLHFTNTPGIGYVALTRGLNPNLDLSARMYHGEWGYYNNATDFYFFKAVTGGEVTLRWKFLGNYNRYFTPYMALGLGARTIKMNGSNTFGIFNADRDHIYEMNIPMGLGAKFNITSRLGVIIQSAVMFPFTSNAATGKDSYNKVMNNTIGLTFSIGDPIACQSGKPLLCPPF